MQKIALKYGFQMFLLLVLLFAVVHLIGISHNYNLRAFNGFVHLGFLYLAIKSYRKAFPNSIGNYLSGVAAGMYMTAVAVALFGSAMMVYLSLDHAFFQIIKDAFPYPDMLSPFTACLGIIVEGVAVGVIGSYIIMRIVDGRMENHKVKRQSA